MMKNGGGSIINVASINGIKPALMQGVYSVTKAGVIALTKSFAKELAPDKNQSKRAASDSPTPSLHQ
jgi:NAD(P)-dependent dehydrogenase (short-subunit alcohol dehydrogenase family)